MEDTYRYVEAFNTQSTIDAHVHVKETLYLIRFGWLAKLPFNQRILNSYIPAIINWFSLPCSGSFGLGSSTITRSDFGCSRGPDAGLESL